MRSLFFELAALSCYLMKNLVREVINTMKSTYRQLNTPEKVSLGWYSQGHFGMVWLAWRRFMKPVEHALCKTHIMLRSTTCLEMPSKM